MLSKLKDRKMFKSIPRTFFKIVFLIFFSQKILGRAMSSNDGTYSTLLELEKKQSATDRSFDLISGGLLAVGIGLYGHYNTNANVLMKLVYTGTETAGVLTVSKGIQRFYSRSLILDLDQTFVRSLERGSSTIELSEAKDTIANNYSSNLKAKKMTSGYSATLLSLLNFFHAYRSTNTDPIMVNVHLFLGVSFGVGGAYELFDSYYASADTPENVSIQYLPYPEITWRF